MKRYPRLNKLALFEDLGYHPHPGQLAVHRSTASRRILACGARWGKSTAAAMEAVAAVLQPCKKSLGWVVAPSYDVTDRIYVNVREILVTRFSHRVIEEDHRWRRIVVRNLGGGVSELRAKSAEHSASLLGEGLDWVIVEEAANLKPDVWEMRLSQRLIDNEGWALIISTPREGWVYDLYLLGQSEDHPDCESWAFASWDNPFLNREVIERERERLPEDVFREQYAGEFVLSVPPRCPGCNGPRPLGEGPIPMFDDDEPMLVCEECGGPTDAQGTSCLVREPRGEVVEEWIRLVHEHVHVPLPIFEEDRPVFTVADDQDEAGFVPDASPN